MVADRLVAQHLGGRDRSSDDKRIVEVEAKDECWFMWKARQRRPGRRQGGGLHGLLAAVLCERRLRSIALEEGWAACLRALGLPACCDLRAAWRAPSQAGRASATPSAWRAGTQWQVRASCWHVGLHFN
jgi:hypothetical protein